jgi:hypothetical protein
MFEYTDVPCCPQQMTFRRRNYDSDLSNLPYFGSISKHVSICEITFDFCPMSYVLFYDYGTTNVEIGVVEELWSRRVYRQPKT